MSILSLTPAQRVECQLLGLDIEPTIEGFYVSRFIFGQRFGVLCIAREGVPRIEWSTKMFETIDEAIEAAANPERFGLGWDHVILN